MENKKEKHLAKYKFCGERREEPELGRILFPFERDISSHREII